MLPSSASHHAPRPKLHVFLAHAGIASRRKAEVLITEGKVRVNGKIITNVAERVNPEKDRVEYDGKQISAPAQFVYYLLHKPAGYLSRGVSHFHVVDGHGEKIYPRRCRFVPAYGHKHHRVAVSYGTRAMGLSCHLAYFYFDRPSGVISLVLHRHYAYFSCFLCANHCAQNTTGPQSAIPPCALKALSARPPKVADQSANRTCRRHGAARPWQRAQCGCQGLLTF